MICSKGLGLRLDGGARLQGCAKSIVKNSAFPIIIESGDPLLFTVSKTNFNEAPFHSIESFTKLNLYKNTANVLYFCLFYYVVDQSNILPMYLPFRNPVWSGLIERSKIFSNLVAMTFDAILQSTFSNAISQTPNFE